MKSMNLYASKSLRKKIQKSKSEKGSTSWIMIEGNGEVKGYIPSSKYHELNVVSDMEMELKKLSDRRSMGDNATSQLLSWGDIPLISKEKQTIHSSELPSGFYKLFEYAYDKQMLLPMEIGNQEILSNFSTINIIEKEVKDFVKDKKLYLELKQMYKRGILLYGPPGTGKTTVLNSFVREYKDSCIIIYMQELIPVELIMALKNDSRLKIFIIEELFTIYQGSNTEELLSFLDGELSVDNALYLATTNYPEMLPANIVNRPGRFDLLHNIGYLSKDDIKRYLCYFLDLKKIDFNLGETKQITIAMLKEVVTRMKIKRLSYEESLEQIKQQGLLAEREFKKSRPVGFDIDSME